MNHSEMTTTKYHGMEIQRVMNMGTGTNTYNYYCPDIRETVNGYNVAKRFRTLSAIKTAICEHLSE